MKGEEKVQKRGGGWVRGERGRKGKGVNVWKVEGGGGVMLKNRKSFLIPSRYTL